MISFVLSKKIQIWLNQFGTIVPIPAICYRHRVERKFKKHILYSWMKTDMLDRYIALITLVPKLRDRQADAD